MILDPIIMQYPENLNNEDFVIATYYSVNKPDTEMLNYAAALAIEQTTGTWTKVPMETAEIRERSIGRVIGVYETPAYQHVLPSGLEERRFIIRIAYPWINFGSQFAMMLSAIFGNISSLGKLKLLDLEFPKTYLETFQGPKFGVQGIRDILGVQKRPLLNNMIKPCTGLSPKETADLAYTVAIGGADIIKDDELVADAPFCPLIERVKHVTEAMKRADEEKGEKTLFAFNITDRTERMQQMAYDAIEAGAECLMVNYNTIGLDATRMLAEDKNIDVPILGHSDFTGAMYSSPSAGLSAALIGAKLPRLAGVDMLIALTPYGKFPMMMDTFIDIGYKMLAQYHNIKPVFPMPGGGTTQGHVEDIIEKFGNDVIIASGAGIHGHRMGATAGAKAFRQAIDAVMDGKSVLDVMEKHEELKVAIEDWGYYREEKDRIFDLKG